MGTTVRPESDDPLEAEMAAMRPLPLTPQVVSRIAEAVEIRQRRTGSVNGPGASGACAGSSVRLPPVWPQASPSPRGSGTRRMSDLATSPRHVWKCTRSPMPPRPSGRSRWPRTEWCIVPFARGRPGPARPAGLGVGTRRLAARLWPAGGRHGAGEAEYALRHPSIWNRITCSQPLRRMRAEGRIVSPHFLEVSMTKRRMCRALSCVLLGSLALSPWSSPARSSAAADTPPAAGAGLQTPAARWPTTPPCAYWPAFHFLPPERPAAGEVAGELAGGADRRRDDQAARLRQAEPPVPPRRGEAPAVRLGLGLRAGIRPAAAASAAGADAGAARRRFSARQRVEKGQTAEAADELADVLTLGRHASPDGITVAVLVRYAIEGIGIETAADQLPRLEAEGPRSTGRADRQAPARRVGQGFGPRGEGGGAELDAEEGGAGRRTIRIS